MVQHKVEFGKLYSIDFTGSVKIGNIPEHICYDRLRDGRIMGLLAEDLIAFSFPRMDRVQDTHSGHDIIYHPDKNKAPIRVQCKSWKGTSCSISPSKMKGKGRKFDLAEYLNYKKGFDAICFIYVEYFPILKVKFLKSETIDKIEIISSNDAMIRKEFIL